MDWSASLEAAAACAVVGSASGWCVPRLIAPLPEPEAEAAPLAESEGAVAPPKPLYVDLAATPWLSVKSAIWAGATAFLVGLDGWTWPLLYLLPLIPLGVALAYIDLRTRLLPTRLIAPSYALVVGAILILTVVTGDLGGLIWAAIGWASAGGLFGLLWLFTRGMGYGDVRLSGVLGLALGYLGWGELLVGVYAGFLLGAIGWIPLRILRITQDRKLPFGPFMLLGAVVGVLWGDDIASLLVA